MPPTVTEQPVTATGTVSDAVADVIAARDVPVFGIMGNGNAYLVGNLTARGTRYVSARHEAGTVAMADAFFRASGRVGVATTTYGAGFTNALTPLAEARIARIPLVLVVGDAPTTGPRAFDIDQRQAAEALGVETLTVTPATARSLTERAFALAERDRRPIVLAIPYDVGTDLAAAPDVEHAQLPPLPPAVAQEPEAAAIERVVAMLAAAERPLIVAGRGAFESGAGADLRAIGDRVGARFATTVMARNLFASEWELGIAGGFATLDAAERMRSADVVLVVGAGLNPFQTRYGTIFRDARAVVRVDAADPAHELVTDPVRADAARFASALHGAIERALPEARLGWRAEQDPARTDETQAVVLDDGVLDDGRLDPRPFARAIDAIVPRERTIVQDGGHFIGWMPMLASVPDPHGLVLVGTAFQAIGLGFPSAVGVSVARPDRTTLFVCGDGGGLMAIADLETLVRTASSCVVVVFNDAAYGAEIHQYGTKGVDTEAMLIDEVDFAAVGRAFGAEGVKARSLDDLDALRDWVARGAQGTFVLDLPVSRSIVADYMLESQRR